MIFTFSSESERDKFEYLYNQYKKLLLHKAYDILKDYQLTEDAVSEAYIRIYKNLHKIDDATSGRTIAFLVTITKNVAFTMLAKEKKQAVQEYDEQMADEEDLEESLLASISSERIRAIIDSLEEELKGVFLMRYAYGYSNKEIAGLFQISENHVGVRLHRVKKKLAALLTKEGYQYA